MTIRMWEKFKSRSGGADGVELAYIVQGTDSDLDVLLHVSANTPTSYNLVLRRGDIRVAPIGVQLWEAVVPYDRPDKSNRKKPREPGSQPKFQFDTTGGRENIKFSRHTTSGTSAGAFGDDPQQVSPAKPAPDFKGLIGVNGDQVEGCEVTVPTFRFQETHYFPLIPFEYANRLYRLTGRVNKDKFRDFDPGEVLFLGASGGQERGKAAEVTFYFDCQPNIKNLRVGDLVIPEKKGWDYLWFWWEEGIDDRAKTIVKRPSAYYIEEVYPRAKFVQLHFILGRREPTSTDVVPTVEGSPDDHFPL